MIRLLLDIWPTVGEKLQKGAMVTVTDKNLRVRYLPVSGINQS